jgi:hypothetical protein
MEVCFCLFFDCLCERKKLSQCDSLGAECIINVEMGADQKVPFWRLGWRFGKDKLKKCSFSLLPCRDPGCDLEPQVSTDSCS